MIKNSDLKLISELRQNSRETLTNISKKLKIPISTLYDKMKQHQDIIITKYTTLLDFNKLGYTCRANIMIKTTREEREKLCNYLKAHQSVNNLFKINNGYDYLIEGIFTHIKDMEDFIEELEEKFNLEQKQTYHIINELKREEFLGANTGEV